jgi:hypothetical protein
MGLMHGIIWGVKSVTRPYGGALLTRDFRSTQLWSQPVEGSSVEGRAAEGAQEEKDAASDYCYSITFDVCWWLAI